MIYDIREYERGDAGRLSALWSEVFGDPIRLTERFFELLPSMGTGFAACLDGEIFGAAYVLDAFLHLPDGATKKLAYIYAVCVDERARRQGLGAELSRACMRKAWEENADVCCTLPAEGSLYPWYERNCGLKAATHCRYETVLPSAQTAAISKLFADEYGFLRADILKSTPHASFGYGYLLFQEAIFNEYGGGFFRCGDGIACGYVEDGVLHIKEALNDTPEFIPALCTMLGAEKAIVRRADTEGEPYIAAYGQFELPPDTVWSLTLD